MNYQQYKEMYTSYIKKAPWQSLAMAFSFVIVLLMMIVLDYFFVGSIIITVPFVVIPYLFCLQIGLVRARMTHEIKAKEFYRPFLVAFQDNIFRIYRPLRIGLFAFLIYIVSSVVTVAVGLVVVQNFFPSLKVLFDELLVIAESSQTIDYEAIMIFLQDHQVAFAPFFTITYAISFFFAYVYFMMKVFYHAFIVNFSLSIPTTPEKLLEIHKQVFPSLRKTYVSFTLKNLYLSLIVIVLGYALGSVLAFILRPSDAYINVIFGVMVASLLLIPMIPRLLTSNEVLFELMMPEYLKHSGDHVKKVYSQFIHSEQLNDAQKEEVQKLLDMMDESHEEGKPSENEEESNKEDDID